jgi:hypothetical protein
MTWAEWYESKYNTSSYYIPGTPNTPSGYYIKDIQRTDTIVEGFDYTVHYVSHGGGIN